MNTINIGILQNILFILALAIVNWITNKIHIEEKQKHITILSTTIIGLIFLSYSVSKLLIDIFKILPMGGM